MELIHLQAVQPPRHGVLRVVACADADPAAELYDVMESSILANSLGSSVGSWHIHALCSAASRADMQTLTVPAANSEGVPAGCVAIADLPNPFDALGFVANLVLVKNSGRSWRLFFISEPDDGATGRALHVCSTLSTRFHGVHLRFPLLTIEGTQEFAVFIRKFDRVLRETTGLPTQVEAVVVFNCDTNDTVPCRLDDFDTFGMNWIALDKPCPADATLRFEMELPRSIDDYEITLTSWKRLPKWPRDDRHAWTRCCVDAVV